MRCLWLIWFFLHASQILWSQSTQWYLEAPKQAYARGPFEISFVLENGKGTKVGFPDFKNLEVLAGPSVSNQYANINGKESHTTTYSFHLRADQPGVVIIGEASIVVNGKSLKTRPATIQIIKQEEGLQTKDGLPAFVKLMVSDHTIYKGQQLVAAYHLYYRGNIGFEDAIQHPPFNGFSAKALDVKNENVPGIQVGGKPYEGVLADAVALFPKTTGKLKIDPSYFPMKERLPNDDPWAYPFGRYRSFQLVTDAEQIEVKPLPLPLPPDFNGVVGKYEGNASLVNNSVHQNQTINLRIEVTGNGDPSVMSPPKLKIPSVLEAYPPKLIHEESRIQNQEWVHQHIWEVPITASDTGHFAIEVLFEYFDTEQKSYKKLDLEPLKVEVVAGNSRVNSDQPDLPTKRGLNMYLVVGCTLIGLAVGAFVYFSRKNQPQEKNKGPNPAIDHHVESQIQPSGAVDRFDSLETLLQQGRIYKLSESLSSMINEDLQAKLGLDKEQMVLHLIIQKLKQKGGDATLISLYTSIRHELEASLYAKMTIGDPEKLLSKSKEFLTRLGSLP